VARIYLVCAVDNLVEKELSLGHFAGRRSKGFPELFALPADANIVSSGRVMPVQMLSSGSCPLPLALVNLVWVICPITFKIHEKYP